MHGLDARPAGRARTPVAAKTKSSAIFAALRLIKANGSERPRRARKGSSSPFLELVDEFPVGYQVLFEQEGEERREHRFPADVFAEDFARVGAV